jgi:hypothetical protein
LPAGGVAPSLMDVLSTSLGAPGHRPKFLAPANRSGFWSPFAPKHGHILF